MLEKLAEPAPHIEVQVLADAHGNVLQLHERDRTLQRRHQKLVEACPAPGMEAALSAEFGRRACALVRTVGYAGASTVEFIAEPPLYADRVWFLEMNTRLKVEPRQRDGHGPRPRGVADPHRRRRGAALGARGHSPRRACGGGPPLRRGSGARLPALARHAGALDLPAEAPGPHLHAGVRQGDVVTPFDDPLLAKLVAHAPTRGEAPEKLGGTLEKCRAEGVRPNADFLAASLRGPEMRQARAGTRFLEAARGRLVQAMRKEPA